MLPRCLASPANRTRTVFSAPSLARAGVALLVWLLLAALPAAPARARVYLDITSPEMRKVRMAIPPFVDTSSPDQIQAGGRNMAALLSRALAFHGFVAVIDPALYGGRQQGVDWSSLRAEFTILGQYRLNGTRLVLELRLIDVQQGRMILGRRYRGPWNRHRTMVLKFCDTAVQTLTGEPGISRTKIAFVSDQTGHKEIYLADVLGDRIRQVTKHRHLAVSPRFSPDDTWLAYTSYHRGNPNLYITNLKTLKTTRPISRRPGLNLAPAWAPDGRTMVITLSRDGNPDLYLMSVQGRVLRRLTRNEGLNVSPSFSPDGTKIAFVSDRSGTPQIYVMDVRSKAVQRITYQGAENTTPAWSPKGDWIAYTGRVGPTHHLFLIRPRGGNPLQLTHDWGDHESPSWSPDGRQLVFSRKRGDKQHLCAIFKNGRGLRRLFPTEPGHQSSPQWSPRPPS